jgi:hypothetical protein
MRLEEIGESRYQPEVEISSDATYLRGLLRVNGSVTGGEHQLHRLQRPRDITLLLMHAQATGEDSSSQGDFGCLN